MDSTGKRVLGFFACLIVLLSGVMVLGAIAPNTVGNLGGVLPLFNATGDGYWVDTITATQFTIHVNADPGQDVDFAWNVARTP